MKIIKKSGIFLSVLILSLFLAGCLDYKTYESTNDSDNESSLLQEIAEIEKELNISETKPIKNETSPSTQVTISLKNETTADKSTLSKVVVNESSLVDFQVKIVDPDNDTISYTFSKPLNEIGKWQTNYGDAGEYVVTITASDGKLTVNKDVLLVVQRVNVPPVIKSIQNVVVKEGETVKLEPQVTDPNGDKVTIKVSDPLTSGNWITDYTSSGEYAITVTASDGELNSVASFLLTVTDVNVPPQISNLTDLSVKEGGLVSLNPIVTDLDKDKVKVTISEPVGDDGIWQTTYVSHGVYTLTVTADDGKDKVTKNVKITVEDVNMPPVIEDIKLN